MTPWMEDQLFRKHLLTQNNSDTEETQNIKMDLIERLWG
jgi:hypothetical protein